MKTRSLLYVGLGVLLSALMLLLLVQPQYQTSKELNSKIVAAQQKIQDFNRIMAELPNYLETRGKLAEQKAKLSSRLYAKEDILRLFRHLEEQARKYDLIITEINPPVEELLRLNRAGFDSSATELLRLNLKLEGTFVGYGKFLSELERADYFRGVTDCSVMGSPESPDPIRMQIGFYSLLNNLESTT